MKLRGLIILLLFLSFSAWSQNGWRKDEMEIIISPDNVEKASILKEYNINCEAASSDGSKFYAYVTPLELQRINEAGIGYTVSINNLNHHYRDFWQRSNYFMTYTQIKALADSLESAFPSICKKVVFGTSVGNRELAALKISDNPELDEPEAPILFDGGIHGDEIMGPELLIRYARELCTQYASNQVYHDLINNREIWIYYMVNPDGTENMSRYNNNFVDCNRDAGYMWNGEGNSPNAISQPETRALRDAFYLINPVIYTNYHSGIEIISYPWSYRSQPTKDNLHIDYIASVYSSESGYSYLPYGQGYNVMYAINGSWKDFQYGSVGNIGWSIEISLDKQPPGSQIGYYYSINAPSITKMIEMAGYGIEGIITDQLTGEPITATVWVEDFYPVLSNASTGDFHKYLLPGSYSVKIVANGYATTTLEGITVPASGSVSLQIQLVPETGMYLQQITSSRIPLFSFSNFTSPAFTPGIIGPPDSIYYSLWKNGWIIADMGDTVFNLPGNDIRVTEGGELNESFKFYSSMDCDGPWTFLGTGIGTSEFDLSDAIGGPVEAIRYLKILDSGTGNTTGLSRGFDLDAVEVINLPTGVSKYERELITVSPNPADDFINVTASGNVTYFIVTSEGKIILTGKFIHSTTIEIRNLKSGIYLLNMQTEKGLLAKKFIKK